MTQVGAVQLPSRPVASSTAGEDGQGASEGARSAGLGLAAIGAGSSILSSNFRRPLPVQVASTAILAGLGYAAGSVAFRAAQSGMPGDQTDAQVGSALVAGGIGTWAAGRALTHAHAPQVALRGGAIAGIGAIGAAAGVGALAMGAARDDSASSRPGWAPLATGGALALGAAALVWARGGVRNVPSIIEAASHTLNAVDEFAGSDRAAVKAAHKARAASELARYAEQFGDDAAQALGRAGKRHVTARAPLADIAAIHPGRAVVEPQRIFVGSKEGADASARVGIAIDRMRASGAFQRKDILVVVPNAMGDTIPQIAYSQELFSGGDTATVVLQTIAKRPWSALQDIKPMGAEQRMLVDAIHKEMAALGRPRSDYRILVDGHCYGALAGAHGFADDGARSALAADVDGVLLTAGPRGWMPHSRSLASADGASTVVADRVADYDAIHTGGTQPRVVFGSHANDPMSIRLRDFWQATDGPSVPVVGGINTLLDLGAYATRPSGKLYDVGHDFRAMGARGVRAAFGHADITDEQVARAEHMIARDEALKVLSGSKSRL